MDIEEVFFLNSELELTKGLNERHSFDVSNSATKLQAELAKWMPCGSRGGQ